MAKKPDEQPDMKKIEKRAKEAQSVYKHIDCRKALENVAKRGQDFEKHLS